MKPIKIIDHARDRMLERGTTESEIKEVIKRGQGGEAKEGRKVYELIFPYHGFWQSKFYEQKKVRAICVEEERSLIVITVYVYYGKWEEER